jgi:hypothetical protein
MIFDKVNLIVWAFGINADNKLIFAFVLQIMNLRSLLFLGSIKGGNWFSFKEKLDLFFSLKFLLKLQLFQ